MDLISAHQQLALLKIALDYKPTAKPLVDSPGKAAEQLMFISSEAREFFVCMSLNSSKQMISRRIISIGTLTSSLVHPREVFKGAILDGAASIIIGHNHPSGNAEQSPEDINVTNRLRKAGTLLGIEVLDHIIVTRNDYSKVP